MKLSDVMSAAGLSSWAEVALLVFFVAFVLIGIVTWLRPQKEIDKIARLPLDNGHGSSVQESNEN